MPEARQESIAMNDEHARELTQEPWWLQTEAMRQRGGGTASPHHRINECRGSSIPEIERTVVCSRPIADLQHIA